MTTERADVYVYRSVEAVDKTIEVAPGVQLDLNKAGEVVGVEILNAVSFSIDGQEPILPSEVTT